ncbi:MAG: cysteine desulfurase/selenocysteine lyase [Myxococcota bacterium]|jgi:cysteine desulfurase/selenocysteine lyase
MSAAVLGSRTLFPTLTAQAYLSHSAIAPVSTPVRAVVLAALDDFANRGMMAFADWVEHREQLRINLATLLGTRSENLALLQGTSAGIAAVAQCFPWRWDTQEQIIVFEGEFPANVTAWQQVGVLHPARPEILMHSAEAFRKPSGDGLAKLEEALKAGQVALVAVSAVQFQTGLRMPIGAMAKLCHAHGAALFVDAIQAVGVVPFDMTASGADFVAGGAHKWLMGVEGAGYLAVAERWHGRLRPVTAGWLSHEQPLDFLFGAPIDYTRGIRPEPSFLEAGSQSTISFAALAAAVELLRDLGIENVFDHVQRYLDPLEAGMVALGFESLRAIDPAQRSGTLSMRAPDGVDVAALNGQLASGGVMATTPEGLLRLAPSWPNALDEVPQVLAAVKAAL